MSPELAQTLLRVHEALVERGAADAASQAYVVSYLENNEFDLALDAVLAGVSAPNAVTAAERTALVVLAASAGWPAGAPMTPAEYIERGLRFRKGTTDVFPHLT